MYPCEFSCQNNYIYIFDIVTCSGRVSSLQRIQCIFCSYIYIQLLQFSLSLHVRQRQHGMRSLPDSSTPDQHQTFWHCPVSYCNSTYFGVLLYLANCVFPLTFVTPKYVIVHCIDGEPPNHFILRNAKFYSRQNLLIYSIHSPICSQESFFLHN